MHLETHWGRAGWAGWLKRVLILYVREFFSQRSAYFLNFVLANKSIIISIYHLGIEQGIIEESAVCSAQNLNLLTKEEILNSLKEPSVSCKDVAFKIFGFSLTTYNIIMSLLSFILSTKIYLTSNDIKK